MKRNFQSYCQNTIKCFIVNEFTNIKYCMQVNNNGDVTFDAPLSQFTSQAFPISGSHKIIAPFWTDIDTRQGGYLWYRTTIEHTLLQRGTNKIRSLFPGLLHFSATWMMVVTWEDVAAYGCSSSGTILCSQVRCNDKLRVKRMHFVLLFLRRMTVKIYFLCLKEYLFDIYHKKVTQFKDNLLYCVLINDYLNIHLV